MKDNRFVIYIIIILLCVIFGCYLIESNRTKKLKKTETIDTTIVYPDSKILVMKHYQEYTNFNWINEIVFICNGDTIVGEMTSSEIANLYDYLISSDSIKLVDLVKHNDKIRYNMKK